MDRPGSDEHSGSPRVSRRAFLAGGTAAGLTAIQAVPTGLPDRNHHTARRLEADHGPDEHFAAMGLALESQPIEVLPLGSIREPARSFVSLGGSILEVELPQRFSLHTVSCHVRFDSKVHSGGFQSTHRGYGFYSLAPLQMPAAVEDVLDLRGGLFVQYSFDWGPEAVNRLTLWQGEFHDLYTFDFSDTEEAVAVLSNLHPKDAIEGVSLRKPWDWAERGDSVTLDFGNYVVEARSVEGVDLPGWPGSVGRHGEFYRIDESLLGIVGAGSFATLQTIDEHGETIDQALQELHRDFRISWLSPTGHFPAAPVL